MFGRLLWVVTWPRGAFACQLNLGFKLIKFGLEYFKEFSLLEFFLWVVKSIKNLIFTDIHNISFWECVSIFGHFFNNRLDFSVQELELLFHEFSFSFDVTHGLEFFESTVDDIEIAHKFLLEKVHCDQAAWEYDLVLGFRHLVCLDGSFSFL